MKKVKIRYRKNSNGTSSIRLNFFDGYENKNGIRKAKRLIKTLPFHLITNPKSKEEEDLNKNVSERNFFCILVCNQCDIDKNNHMVSFDQGIRLANTLQIPFVTTSAKYGINIDLLFTYLVRGLCLQHSLYNANFEQNMRLKDKR